jgi:hypothetical protein
MRSCPPKDRVCPPIQVEPTECGVRSAECGVRRRGWVRPRARPLQARAGMLLFDIVDVFAPTCLSATSSHQSTVHSPRSTVQSGPETVGGLAVGASSTAGCYHPLAAGFK